MLSRMIFGSVLFALAIGTDEASAQNCEDFTSRAQIEEAYASGRTDLDRDGDGVPCEGRFQSTGSGAVDPVRLGGYGQPCGAGVLGGWMPCYCHPTNRNPC